MLLIVLASLTLAQPVSESDLAKCLGSSSVAMDRFALAQQRAAAGEEAWARACRDARNANAKRVRLAVAVLNRQTAPEPFASAAKYAHAAKTAQSPTHAMLFQHVARDQVARSALSRRAKALYAGELSPLAEALLNGLISADALEADRGGQAWLSVVLRQRGWFTISRDGPEAETAAWLIAQHSDGDRDFQRTLIDVLEPLAAAGETSARRFAFLYDRWAMGVGAPLRFAINGKCVAPGRWEPLHTEDLPNLDARRAAAGLPSLADWTARQSATCR
jgi:hypothetical protein